MKKTDISVIIPLYRGNKYVTNWIKLLADNFSNYEKQYHGTCEAVLVNDCPEEKIELGDVRADIRLYQARENLGIHGARVFGLSKARGDYVVFLDQDDRITEDYLVSQIRHLGDADAVLCDGWIERYCMSGKRIIYASSELQKNALCLQNMIDNDNQIVSPGQVLMKREAIPGLWKEQILKNNGVDDYLLWLLMLAGNRKFSINPEKCYIHVGHAANTSNNALEMYRSRMEMADILDRHQIFSKEQTDIIRISGESGDLRYAKQADVISLYDQWMFLSVREISIADYFEHRGVKRIAVYGMNFIGNRLYDALSHRNIKVCFGIDQRADHFEYNIPVFRLEDIEPEEFFGNVDAVVVTVVSGAEQIKDEVRIKYNGPVWSMREILAELTDQCGRKDTAGEI